MDRPPERPPEREKSPEASSACRTPARTRCTSTGLFGAHEPAATSSTRMAPRSSGWPTRCGTGRCWRRPRNGRTSSRRGASQGFTAAQYVATSWRTAPDGGPDGPTYTTVDGGRLATVNPSFFRRLDARLGTLADAGLVAAPVLLWAIARGEGAETNPGSALSEEDCVVLARYQIARWHAHPVCWILNGDGRYTGDDAVAVAAHRARRLRRPGAGARARADDIASRRAAVGRRRVRRRALARRDRLPEWPRRRRARLALDRRRPAGHQWRTVPGKTVHQSRAVLRRPPGLPDPGPPSRPTTSGGRRTGACWSPPRPG